MMLVPRLVMSAGGADYKRPIGVLSTCAGLRERLALGWPNLVRRRSTLAYEGPLPKSCRCGRNDSPLIGVSDSALGMKFWDHCEKDGSHEARLNSLRDGGSRTDFAPLDAASIAPFRSVSLLSGTHSLRSTYGGGLLLLPGCCH